MITKSFNSPPIGNFVYREPWNYPIGEFKCFGFLGNNIFSSLNSFEIVGSTKVNGVNKQCIIQVFDKNWNLLKTEKSDTNGKYKIGNLYEDDDYYILCIPLEDSVCPRISGKVKATKEIKFNNQKLQVQFNNIEEMYIDLT